MHTEIWVRKKSSIVFKVNKDILKQTIFYRTFEIENVWMRSSRVWMRSSRFVDEI
jgi:hypothetical protein